MSFWYAFRTDDPAKVVEHLELKETRPCRFADRVTSLVGVTETMFVTPAMNGWVLAFGVWPSLDDEVRFLVETASLHFGEAQAFACDDAGNRRAWLVRSLFALPWMLTMSFTCSDEIPHERGRELAAFYYSVRAGR